MAARRRTPVIRGDGTVAVILDQGLIAVIDEADAHLVTGRTWRSAKVNKHSDAIYAVGRVGCKDIYLHRHIMSAPGGLQVDHADGNGLNNRRANLRLATHSQNRINSRLYANNKSGFRGVSALPSGKWEASAKQAGRKKFLGHYSDPAAAARAYDDFAREHYGPFARLNFP